MAGRTCRLVSVVTYSTHTELHLIPQRSLETIAWAKYTIACLQSGITKLKKLLEGENESSFNAEQYMMLYT